MNTLGTRCPACLTAFKVNADLLRMRDGYGACGQCAQVFDMQAALFLLPPHDTHVIDIPVKANQEWPELSAVVTILNDSGGKAATKDTNTTPISRNGALKRISPVSFVPQPITDMFYRVTGHNEAQTSSTPAKSSKPSESANVSDNISFHTEQPTSAEIPLTAPIAKVAPVVITYNAPPVSVLQGIKGEKSIHTKWVNAACWVLLVGACLQTAGLFSREVSRTLPFTRAVYEQLNLPTDRG